MKTKRRIPWQERIVKGRSCKCDGPTHNLANHIPKDGAHARMLLMRMFRRLLNEYGDWPAQAMARIAMIRHDIHE